MLPAVASEIQQCVLIGVSVLLLCMDATPASSLSVVHIQVVKWCPRNNPLRAVLGALGGAKKSKALKTYPATEDAEGDIYVNLG